MENKNMPAFPTTHGIDNGTVISQQIAESTWQAAGLTKRECFAAMAMQGWIASYAGATKDPDPEVAARKCVELADALLNELSKA